MLVLAAVEPEISGILGPIQQVSHDGSRPKQAWHICKIQLPVVVIPMFPEPN